MSNLLWEINWIRNNYHLYDSKLHAESVISNITKRYQINKLISIIERLKDSK